VKQGTKNKKWNKEQKKGNREQRTGNREYGTEDRKIRNKEHFTGKRDGKRICSCLILIGHIFNTKCKEDTVV
jgi:hypothetical protein